MPIISSPGGGTALGGVTTVTGTPTAGQIIVATSGTAATWQTAVGAEYDYTQITGNVTVAATTEATATTIVTAGAVTYNGTDVLLVEFFAQALACNGDCIFVLYDGASSIGQLGEFVTDTAGNSQWTGVYLARRLTPSAAAHTYSVRAFKISAGSAVTLVAGAGGSGNPMPAFVRSTRAA